MGTQTMWGISQSKQKCAVGINFYSTASHGGFILSKKRNEQMPELLRNDNRHYEEDCEWCKVVLAYPEYFVQEMQESAKSTLKNWFPATYEQFYNVTLKRGESTERDRELFYNETFDKFVIRSASTYIKQPQNVVVYAKQRSTNITQYFFMDKTEYHNLRQVGFVIEDINKLEPATENDFYNL